jgi:hypothetical protein
MNGAGLGAPLAPVSDTVAFAAALSYRPTRDCGGRLAGRC